MSQPLPEIKIAELLTGTRVGMLTARITDVSVFTQISKFSNPVGQTVNVYKLSLIDESGSITYSDWCKKEGVQRSYKKGQIIRFHHAKLKPSTNIDATTGQLYPPNVTVEKATIIELLNEDGTAPVPKNLSVAPTTMAPITGLPAVASSPVATTAGIPKPSGPEWMIVKAQYPKFYTAVDVLFEKIYEKVPEADKALIQVNFSGLMDMIWGA